MTEITYQTTAEDIASRSFHVTVPAEQLAVAEKKAAREYAKNVRLPGFRKGQAPEGMIRKRFSGEIRRYVLEEAMRMGWEKILGETALRPVVDPQVRNVSMEEGKPLEFDLVVEIRPELTLEKTGGFTVNRPGGTVTDAQVEEQLNRLREERAAWEPIPGDRAAPGNLVNVTVSSMEDGKEVPGTPYEFIIGEGRAIPALEEKIMTLQPGETVETDLRYPDDHPDEARRGTSRQVRITLHGAKTQLLPPLDDAFAREVSNGTFEDVAALQAAVRTDMEAEAVRNADQLLRDQLIQQIAEANAVPAPHGLTHRLMHAYAEAYKIEPGQLGAFESSFQPIAEAQVRRELIVDAVATAQNLRATESDVDDRVGELAAARGVDRGALYASLQKGNRLGDLERSITEDRVFQWLLSQSTVNEGAA